MKKGLYVVGILGAMLLAALLILFCGRGRQTEREVVRDTITTVDTVAYYVPVAKDSVRIRYIVRTLPLANDSSFHNDGREPQCALSDDSGSAAVEIPITQTTYEGADYRAYVSGFEAKLDSIFVFPTTTTIRETVTLQEKPKRWSIGVVGGAGYGFFGKRLDFFVGVGVTYSLVRF